MKIRAVIFDVYGTLMQVGPAPANADSQWQKLFLDTFGTPPIMGRLEFSVACNRAITMRHRNAHGRGIAKPEILWPMIVAEVLPGFAKLKPQEQEEFVYRQIQIGRTISPMPGMVQSLRWILNKRGLLGICSNAQAYTLRELDSTLQPGGLGFHVFDSDLIVFSFQHGFSKPDPHCYQILLTRLEARGIRPIQTLMVGDRLDNDIEPARAMGFHTWHLKSPSPETCGGGPDKFYEFLARAV